MTRRSLVLTPLLLGLAACAARQDGETLSKLRGVSIEIEQVYVENGLEKAIEGYRQFLAATPASAMTPEAIRRLADLKVEREYGLLGGAAEGSAGRQAAPAAAVESEAAFEERATAAALPLATLDDYEAAQQASAWEAIALYRQLLEEHPDYLRRDQVLYQLARAYEELGEVEEAMRVMDRMVGEYRQSPYLDEVQFRRGEYFFTRSRYLDAEDAYLAVTELGPESSFYELSLYKLGWSLYKQELYEEGLHSFFRLLDHKVADGVELGRVTDNLERQRVDDTFRVVSFSFSYLGGPEAVDDYFDRFGARAYEENVYSNLGEHYLETRRYNDAAEAYSAFVRRHPFHRASPRFDMRVIEIYKEGGFPRLVIDANKAFARKYGLRAEYWQHFEPAAYPTVLGYLKQTLQELANHYHALYQDEARAADQPENFAEALLWYREYLRSFPLDPDSPPINRQLADLLLENEDYAEAAREYERTAYDYGDHAKAAEAGHAAVYAYREHLDAAADEAREAARREAVRASLRFGNVFPQHEHAALVLGAAAADLYTLQDHAEAATVGLRVVEDYPEAEAEILRSAWTVYAHASFELEQFAAAEQGYAEVLQRTAEDAAERADLYENLAAAIYKQGELAVVAGDHAAAAEHFLRIAAQAPDSQIRPTAEFDGAVALIRLEHWGRAAEVLRAFRSDFPGHELQPEATKRIAYVYRQAGELALAAAEYERIETEADEDEVRRGALLIAAELYEEDAQPREAIRVYRRYLEHFPAPLEPAVEARHRLALAYQAVGDVAGYHQQLRQLVAADARAGAARTDRTRYLAATSALVLAKPLYQELVEIALVQPFDRNLRRKRAAMQKALDAFAALTEYEVGESTAAATYFIAEIYGHFSKALLESERPDNLSPLELEEYEMLLEDQAFPFEEQAIEVHMKNLELMSVGIYNGWIENSLARLAVLMPARYAKPEESSGFIENLAGYEYEIVRPAVEEPEAEAELTEAEPTEAEPTEVEPTEVEPTEVEPTEVEPTEVEPAEVEPTEVTDRHAEGED